MKNGIQFPWVGAGQLLCVGLVTGSGGMAAERSVPSDHPTIQAAVDAAENGDTIRISSGVYTEQVQIISKNLSLIGQPGTVLRATANLALALGAGENSFPVVYARTSEVTIRGLTFEGERLAGRYEGPGSLRGILLRGSTATVDQCAFYGFRPNPAEGEEGFALTASGGTEQVSVRVSNSTFADNQIAIYLIGYPGRKSVNATIENNRILGQGSLNVGLPPSGVVIREGVGGRIAGNAISGFSYTGTSADFPFSFGIEASYMMNSTAFGILEMLTIEGNILRNNQIHISLVNADGSTVGKNRLEGTAPGNLQLGMSISGKDVMIAGNQLQSMPEGIRLLGDDPMFGELLGVAANAQVSGNRFCGVTVPVRLQRLATATETGSATNSCGSPSLTIESGVLVSWPGEEEGWTIEAAPGVDGPWSVSDATPFFQHGNRTIAVPSNSPHQFFRLR